MCACMCERRHFAGHLLKLWLLQQSVMGSTGNAGSRHVSGYGGKTYMLGGLKRIRVVVSEWEMC